MDKHIEDARRPSERRVLGVWDIISIVIGIVVGVSIFRTPPLVFENVPGPWVGVGAWALGGFLSLVGAFCYAELATTYPQSGGDYVYLTRAYGRAIGFLFGWAQLAAILTGSIGALAYVFADYAAPLFGAPAETAVWFAVAAVAFLTLTNALGLAFGVVTQNVLTAAKVLGLAAVIVAGFVWGDGADSLTNGRPLEGPGFGLAMVFVLYAYGGWNDAAFVAAEVRDPRRTIPRALGLSIGVITAAYVLVNLAYLWALGFEGVRGSSAPAAAVLGLALGAWGANVMSVLVMVSALGAVNGTILTGSRVLSRMGRDHSLFAFAARWDTRRGAPTWALVTQASVAVLLIALVGTPWGRHAVDALLGALVGGGVDWEWYDGGFGALVTATAPVFWLFFLLTGVSLIVLRRKDRHVDRPFSTPLYPFTPLLFCAMCGYMLYASLAYAQELALVGVAPVLLGVPLYLLSRISERTGNQRSD